MQSKKRILQTVRIVIPVLVIISVVVFVPWDIVSVWISPLPDTVREQVDNTMNHGIDGMIVYVDKAGKTPELYAAGWKNKNTRVPANPNALFKIASISKLYIAAATVKLVHDGKLSLNDTLTDHLPGLEGRIENAGQITLKMLLQHRSGIPNFTDQESFDWFTSHTESNVELQRVLDQPADFLPDANYRYSNTNYLLLGRILDKTLEYSHHLYIAREILAPLGLTDTYGLLSEVNYEDVVSGYWFQYEDDLRKLDYVIPGGSMIATAQDVGIFLRALIDGSLLNDQEQAIYSSIYGYEHTGWLPGYYSIVRYNKDIDTVVVLFVNTTGGNLITISDIVYNRIVRILYKNKT